MILFQNQNQNLATSDLQQHPGLVGFTIWQSFRFISCLVSGEYTKFSPTLQRIIFSDQMFRKLSLIKKEFHKWYG